MHLRSISRNFLRFLHQKGRLPELDFTKPSSDRVKKSSFQPRLSSESDEHRSLLKVPLRGQCLFGLYPVQLALKMSRRKFFRLYLSQTSDDQRTLVKSIQERAEALAIPIEHTSTNVLNRLAFDRPHQGVCLDCSPLPLQEISQLESEETQTDRLSLDLCLVKIHDPMNLGAMIRTAHFFGTDRIVLGKGTCQPSPVASKASSGALELMSIYTCSDLEKYFHNLKEQGTAALFCASHQGTQPLRTFNLQQVKERFASTTLRRLIVLIGNEHDGIPDEIRRWCHFDVCIEADRTSEISSLNASVACALFLYHLSAQMDR